ncbi:MAG: AMP-binding protein, partial [Okeania sp. SIO1H6]|nr:AMP-binding protein [Okeania sp. SIO1H6]
MQTTTIRGFQLSPQQKRLWQLQQDNSAYLTQFSLLVEGNLQVNILKAAIQKSIDRHGILRTIFRCLSGKKMPVMMVENNCLPVWQDIDLSIWEEEYHSAKIEEIFQKERSQDFDLEKGSVLHCYLVKLSPNRHILLISLPALCADTQTIRNMVAEIGTLYSNFLKNQESDNKEIMQYLQVSEWQNQLLVDEEAETANEYWHQQRCSASDSDRWKLPWEKHPEARSPFNPKSVREVISPEITTKIVALGEQYDTSPQVVLLACWQILIWRLTREQDIMIGRKSDRREYEELEDVLGLFATWLPIKRHLLPDLPFCDLLELNQATIDHDEEWEDYFVPEPVENIDTLVFPFGFEFDELPENQFAGSVSFSLERQYSCIEPFKVKLSCTQNKELLNIDFYYDVNYFSVETIQTLSRQFQTLLVSAIENPKATIGQLEILSQSDRQQLLIEFNQTQVDYPKDLCIHEIFAAQVEKTPDNIAVVFEEQQLTYAELNARANQLARYLQGQGVKPETLVGVYLERSPLVIVSILGILKAGGAYLPLDPALATSGLDFRLQDAQAMVLLTQEELVKNLPENTPKVLCLDAEWEIVAQEASDNPSNEVTPENLVYTIYTSGSTGEPKGVAIEHQQLLNYLHSIQGILNLPPGSSFANVSTFAADLGNTVIFPSLCSGGCLHIISSERVPDPQALADYFQLHPIDCLKIVPSHLEALLTYEHPEKIIPQQRLILGGEATSWNLIEQVRKIAPECKIINHYG